MKKLLLINTLLILLFASCKSSYSDLSDGMYADIQTNKGDIVVKLHYKATPVTVANFVSLAEGNNPFVKEEYKNKKYYDGVIFHRVIKDFMIQGGDPTGTGSGSPGYKFKDEIVDTLKHDKAGILSMANAGPKTNGSQFFITHTQTPWLNGKHTVFGEVVKGLEVVDSIANVKTDEKDRPLKDVVMKRVEIIRKGKEAKKFDAVKVLSNYFEEEEKAIKAYTNMLNEFIKETQEQSKVAKQLESGLKIYYLKEAPENTKPKIGQSVLVKYAGYFNDGKLFDTNIEEVAKKYNKFNHVRKQMGGYNPVTMLYSPEAQLIAGFREGLLQLREGEKARLFIPSHLGYGTDGLGPVPPNADLIFDIEIVKIK